MSTVPAVRCKKPPDGEIFGPAMRLVCWNANGKFREKIELFSPREHDLLVIQECENTELSKKRYQQAGWQRLWLGENKNKGLGVFTPIGTKLKKLSWRTSECRYFLPVEFADGVTMVAVWAMGGTSPRYSYAGQVRLFIHDNKRRLRSRLPILVGDFNSNAIWDKRHSASNHTANNDELESMGLSSLYHAQEKCEQGEEREPTFFLYRNPEKPYHLDYIYLPESLRQWSHITVGEPDKWLVYSDHMPLFVTLKAGCQ